MRNLISFLIIVTLISCGFEKNYTIIKEDKNVMLKKDNIDVQLNQEINETELKKIAFELKESRNDFKMLWIFYYLPGQEVGNGAWATTHFTPDLEVKIIGATKDASEAMNKIEVTGEILNSWFDNDAIMPNKTYLVKENNKLYMKTLYPKNSLTEASEIIREVFEKNKGDVMKYDFDNSNGEYFIVEKNGNLGMYGPNGKFKEAVQKK